MKWLLVLFFPFGLIHAQITVTGSNFSSAGDVDVFSSVNPITVVSPELTGANYTWDFSSLTYNGQRSDTLLSVSSTPVGYQFYFNNSFLYPDHVASYGVPVQTPNLGSQIPFQDVVNFYRLESDAYINVGFGASVSGLPLSVRNEPVDTIYDLPLDYGDVFSDTFAFNISVTGVGYYGQEGRHVDTVDGWGTITTPYGTFDVLRIKTVLSVSDTTYLDALSSGTAIVRPVQTNYTWISQTEGAPVFRVSVAAGQVVSAEYLDTLHGIGIDEIQSASLMLYPNPSRENVSLRLVSVQSGPAMVSIIDNSGRELQHMTLNLHAGSGNYNIDLTNIPSGIYHVRITRSTQVLTKKLIVIE